MNHREGECDLTLLALNYILRLVSLSYWLIYILNTIVYRYIIDNWLNTYTKSWLLRSIMGKLDTSSK